MLHRATHNHILIVDDNAMIRDTLKAILSKEGYDVADAKDGQDAFQKFKKNGFDMVITDLHMPMMSGVTLAQMIKGINKNVPVIMVTGSRIIGAMEGVIDAFIEKPFDIKTVLDVVAKY